MRHVVVMTLTGSIGLMFMFLVDAATLFWVSYLGVESFVAAMGFAFTIQFFTISVGIGLMIAATALVAKSIGQGNWEQARNQTTSSAIYAFLVQSIVAGGMWVFRRPLLELIGARGDALESADLFLAISLPSLPLMALGMVGSAILRAEGDAIRSMLVTLSAGIVAMIVDPLLILGLGLEVKGAAIGVFVSRVASSILAIYFVIKVHNLAAKPNFAALQKTALPFFVIALPALMTQLSTPFGNSIVTRLISEHGDGAVAGFTVVSRITVLAFGGLFSLSGAIGGIVGQNFGAGNFDRVKSTYRDALLFCVAYTLVMWVILMLCTNLIGNIFNLGTEARAVVWAFNLIGAFAYMFTGALFVANAAFNNLGRPQYSTLANWSRDGILVYPIAAAFSAIFGAVGVIYGFALASMIAGILAAIWGWRFVSHKALRDVSTT